ncbi:RNA helicase [Marasmius sp. AFHP31]|nr:RNA helicase [Marasmius sp. AFHP31]
MLQICGRCRHALFPELSRLSPATRTSRHYRTGGSGDKKSYDPRQDRKPWSSRPPPQPRSGPKWVPTDLNKAEYRAPKSYRIPKPWRPQLTTDNPKGIIRHVQKSVHAWIGSPILHQRLESFGVPEKEVPILLEAFEESVQAGEVTTRGAYNRYALIRFGTLSPSDNLRDYTDLVMTSVLYAWATDTTPMPHSEYPTRQAELHSRGVSEKTLNTMTRLFEATSNPFPPDKYPGARRLHRKVIMHVGPTNSGKTHNALRALAAAPTGVYAGPLRLLAHEIWDRLNQGKIVPLGVEEKQAVKENEAIAMAALDSNLDDAPPIPPSNPTSFKHTATGKDGNPVYARQCNMVTGEELRIVGDDAPLMSCTVEMLSPGATYDVAVIDEIQMIGDETRGNAWTLALIGANAKELHLCGEETAVPLVEELLKGTNDELIVHRYQRLTPLTVDEESLHGDLSRVEKGDCIVAFSRSRIFQLKRWVEEKTGMKCAVVYGQLPPELRSRQADLFNDPDNDYDVIIGSDAIGMGLNLKIRRVVFDAMEKWNGEKNQPLSVSQTKQIAGRAGRYGLGTEGGLVTTLWPRDLPLLKEILAQPAPDLTVARLDPALESMEAVSHALPEEHKSSIHMIIEAHRYIGILGAGDPSDPQGLTSAGWYRYGEHSMVGKDGSVANIMDKLCALVASSTERDLTADDEWGITPHAAFSYPDQLLLMRAPIPWKIKICRTLCNNLVKKFLTDYSVSVTELVAAEGETYLDVLEGVEKGMEDATLDGSKRQKRVKPVSTEVLSQLEALHRVLGLYSWLAFRHPVAFYDVETVEALKPRVEKALQWALTSTMRVSKQRMLKEGLSQGGEERKIKFASSRSPHIREGSTPITLI